MFCICFSPFTLFSFFFPKFLRCMAEDPVQQTFGFLSSCSSRACAHSSVLERKDCQGAPKVSVSRHLGGVPVCPPSGAQYRAHTRRCVRAEGEEQRDGGAGGAQVAALGVLQELVHDGVHAHVVRHREHHALGREEGEIEERKGPEGDEKNNDIVKISQL